ncbi:hypothetical protein AB0J90_05970 [Micromonospora sp. NPDC049523]|uniref:hypothetical protein n=1 Tax=Micromonospora sp. NPDC049523 TaxID=3155921 RepID=UPI00343D51F3
MKRLRAHVTPIRTAFAAAVLVGIVATGAAPAAAAVPEDPPGACASCFTDPDERPMVITPQAPRPVPPNQP